jgi:hypothetical protein
MLYFCIQNSILTKISIEDVAPAPLPNVYFDLQMGTKVVGRVIIQLVR